MYFKKLQNIYIKCNFLFVRREPKCLFSVSLYKFLLSIDSLAFLPFGLTDIHEQQQTTTTKQSIDADNGNRVRLSAHRFRRSTPIASGLMCIRLDQIDSNYYIIPKTKKNAMHLRFFFLLFFFTNSAFSLHSTITSFGRKSFIFFFILFLVCFFFLVFHPLLGCQRCRVCIHIP